MPSPIERACESSALRILRANSRLVSSCATPTGSCTTPPTTRQRPAAMNNAQAM